jgi:hypothetical protein
MLAVAYANGRVSHARQVKGDHPDKKIYPGPRVLELDVTLTIPPCEKYTVAKPQRNEVGRIPWQQHEAVQRGLRLQKRNKLELNIGTWNVCSLYRAGQLRLF